MSPPETKKSPAPNIATRDAIPNQGGAVTDGQLPANSQEHSPAPFGSNPRFTTPTLVDGQLPGLNDVINVERNDVVNVELNDVVNVELNDVVTVELNDVVNVDAVSTVASGLETSASSPPPRLSAATRWVML
jgi:hypothetical protein